ncbi:hypothetical protein CVT24_000078 [Panaeolus cyanescens]|uniref:Uncharacterized protein n=1 Tax=Panaeolus cyanescens TaxID=181874 RepID=A0A409VSN1_9AGAR|nr:hypothetical protein CVT24_000078 [Panaeolus cyanescens]
MKLISSFISLALAATAYSASVNFYTTREGTCGDPPTQEYRGVACNTCVDPPLDWGGAYVFDVSGDTRVSMHNQDNCTPGSQVGQWYGNVCARAGATALRSVWVACPGQRLAESNTTIADADKATLIEQN